MAVSADPRGLLAPLFALLAALLAAPACSPGTATPPDNEAQHDRATPAPTRSVPPSKTAKLPRTSGEMQREALASDGPSSTPAGPEITDRRCGWLSNPTPGNWWLFDGHREFILATQGGDQAAGFDELPDMSTAGWVETNGHHGYGCACMTLSYHLGTLQVARIADPAPKPLKQCRADRSLPRP